jgi:uncharacterized protein
MGSDPRWQPLLAKARTIAVVGAKDKPGHPVDRVGRYLIDSGFDVVPVHPKRATVWGLRAHPSLLDIPTEVDLVNLFRAPEHCPEHARECLRMASPPAVFWMQSGISSPECRQILAASLIVVVEDSCIMIEHQRMLQRGLS